MQEVGKEIKGYTELNGRTDSNMIDALNAMYNYGVTKDHMLTHIESRELTLASQSAGGLVDEYETNLNYKLSAKIEALQQTFSNADANSGVGG